MESREVAEGVYRMATSNHGVAGYSAIIDLIEKTILEYAKENNEVRLLDDTE